MLKIGGNNFIDCTIPIAFLNRYLIIESNNPELITVILNDNNKPVFEIIKNQPSINSITNVTKTGAGIITVTDKSGKFIYKIRPQSQTSIMFGKIKQDEIIITVNDKSILVNSNVFERNTIIGSCVGISVYENGSISICSPLPKFLQNAKF